jgi:predicted acyl esterase
MSAYQGSPVGYDCLIEHDLAVGMRDGVALKADVYRPEADDGADTLAWMKAQPWCNGRIGTLGLSYTTALQQALAIRRPEGLVTQLLFDGGYNYHSQTRGGARRGLSAWCACAQSSGQRSSGGAIEPASDQSVARSRGRAVERLNG